MDHNGIIALGAAALLLLMDGCTDGSFLASPPRMGHQGGKRTPAAASALSQEEESSGGIHVYATAIRFARGYDWQEDSIPRFRFAELVLLRDGHEIMSMEAGSTEPYSHRLIDGHLYYADSGREDGTTVSRDGDSLFTIPAKESVLGLAVLSDSTVLTVGQSQEQGLSFRRNGETVFQDAQGTLLGDADEGTRKNGLLSVHGGMGYYAYSVRVGSSRQYRVMREGDNILTLSQGKVNEMLDMRIIEGEILRVEKSSPENSSTLFVIGDSSFSLDLTDEQSPRLCHIIPWNGEPAVKGYIQYPDGQFRHFVKGIDGDILETEKGERLYDILEEDGEAAYLVSEEGDMISQAVREDDGAVPDLSGGLYRSISHRCVLLSGGHLYLALTGVDGTPNTLFVDDSPEEIPFNGYFTSVWVGE